MTGSLVEKLKSDYKHSLTDKAHMLEQFWGRTDADLDPLLKFLHQLAGSAGMYGYDEITAQAIQLRTEITDSKLTRTAETQYQSLYRLLLENAADQN